MVNTLLRLRSLGRGALAVAAVLSAVQIGSAAARPYDGAGASSLAVALSSGQQLVQNELGRFTDWTGVLARYQTERAQTACGGRSCPAREWAAAIDSLRGLSLTAQIQAVNAFVNQATYVADWGDSWATPFELFANGGDCEDFAAAKFLMLRELGVPNATMRITVVRDVWKRLDHAILVVDTPSGAVVLDNQVPQVLAASQVSHYQPVYSVNETTSWFHLQGLTGVTTAAR